MLKFCQGYIGPHKTDHLSKVQSAKPKLFCGKHESMKVVQLQKDPVNGLGMVISCGNTYDTLLHGAFIERIHPGGPADLDGNICEGDQIMSVNDTDVQNDYYLDVIDLLKCSKSPVELVISKTNNSPVLTPYQKKEIIEKPLSKSKAWICGDENLKYAVVSDSKLEKKTPIAPIPKPRRKLIEKKQGQLNLDIPDLTINHSTVSFDKTGDDENNCNLRNKQFSRENCNIPDIIASQMKPESLQNLNRENFSGKFINYPPVHSTEENNLLPGEVYHVVLDKKGGSLGLNIFQGTEPNCSEERHIYIHSVIPCGAAELDGRIKPGDKLLEVNGTVLENLSYQEVVTKLRESPQVAHLVLEKGESEQIQTTTEDQIRYNYEVEKDLNFQVPKSVDDVLKCTSPKLNHSSNYSCYFSQESTNAVDENLSIDHAFKEMFEENVTDAFLSLPVDIANTNETYGAKETNSAPSSYQECDSVINGSSSPSIKIGNAADDPMSSPYVKVQKQSIRFQNSLTSYKSSPNLAENSDEDEDKINTSGSLYRNRSTDCLLYSPNFMNPHRALFDLYQNYAYIRGSSSNIHQIPAVPIRKKKLKKLEDIYNYCNSGNTFYVTIPKSSRGLGLSVSGGVDASRRDPFSQLIQIRKLYPLQPALECGKLALGDVLLEVNGTSMIGLTNAEALEVLRSAPTDVVLRVFRPSKSLIPSFSIFKGGIWPFFDSSSSSASSSLSRTENNTYDVETGEFEVTLIKRGGSLGFTISKRERTEESLTEGIFVKALVKEPAVSDGRIQPGDRILQVNGTAVSNMSHAEAIEFIRNTPNTVTLRLTREDPPLTPDTFDDTITKPLRWEAVELLNDRVKHKDNCDTAINNRKMKRKIGRSSNAPSNSSTESTSSSSSGGQEHIIDESGLESCVMSEELTVEGGGLQRNQRPKSLDVLNSSDRKRLTGFVDDDSFHRQSSVMCPNAETKVNEKCENGTNSEKKGRNLLKWRGSTLPDSEESSSPEMSQEVSITSFSNSCSTGQSLPVVSFDEDEDDRPVPFPRTSSYANEWVCNDGYASEWVHTFDVDLDRGWHGRLGFSLCDPSEVPTDSSRNKLPMATEVKAVYPGSLAEKDGRIKVGDRLVEVNRECLLGKSAHEVIDILRKTRGVIRMVFCRLIQRL